MGTPPNIGGAVSGAVASVPAGPVTGDLNDISGNTATDTWAISTAASYGTASINTSTGLWSYTLDASHPAVQALAPGQTMTDTFTVRLSDTWGNDTQLVTITITGVPCFAAGTRILTDRGWRAVETLVPGDRVQTLDDGVQPLRWIGRFAVSRADLARSSRHYPVRIAAGAFGPGLPRADLRLSRQHRILLTGAEIAAICGCPEALVPAHRLLGLAGVELLQPQTAFDYFHLLLDRHQVIFAEGLAAESLLMAGESLRALPPQALDEIDRLFDDPVALARLAIPARPIPPAAQQVQITHSLRRHGMHCANDPLPA